MSRQLHSLILGALLSLVACSTREQVRETAESEQPSEQTRKAPLSRFEARFNPSDYDEEIEEAQKPRELERPAVKEEGDRDSLVVQSEVLQGFRIQIFATPSIDEANAMRMTAVQRMTDDSVYVVFDPPVYKVRLGDFRTRMEASQRLAFLVDHGFPDAWVVSDRIILRKFVRTQSSDFDR